MSRVVVVSTHLDDAALSCWSVLGQGIEVVTVFTGCPGRPGFLSDWDRQSGSADSDARMSERIEENQAALAVVGATAVNLGAIETQYGGGGASASLLREHLVDAEQVWVPAGAGIVHVNSEHIRVRDACLLVRPDASFYADQPYSQFQPAESFDSRDPLPLAVTAGTTQMTIRLNDRQRAEKEQALRCYAGEMRQLERIFGPFLSSDRLTYELLWHRD